MVNGPEEILAAALLDIDGYPVGLSDDERGEMDPATQLKADEAISNANADLEKRAAAMAEAIKNYFQAKFEQMQDG